MGEIFEHSWCQFLHPSNNKNSWAVIRVEVIQGKFNQRNYSSVTMSTSNTWCLSKCWRSVNWGYAFPILFSIILEVRFSAWCQESVACLLCTAGRTSDHFGCKPRNGQLEKFLEHPELAGAHPIDLYPSGMPFSFFQFR